MKVVRQQARAPFSASCSSMRHIIQRIGLFLGLCVNGMAYAQSPTSYDGEDRTQRMRSEMKTAGGRGELQHG